MGSSPTSLGSRRRSRALRCRRLRSASARRGASPTGGATTGGCGGPGRGSGRATRPVKGDGRIPRSRARPTVVPAALTGGTATGTARALASPLWARQPACPTPAPTCGRAPRAPLATSSVIKEEKVRRRLPDGRTPMKQRHRRRRRNRRCRHRKSYASFSSSLSRHLCLVQSLPEPPRICGTRSSRTFLRPFAFQSRRKYSRFNTGSGSRFAYLS